MKLSQLSTDTSDLDLESYMPLKKIPKLNFCYDNDSNSIRTFSLDILYSDSNNGFYEYSSYNNSDDFKYKHYLYSPLNENKILVNTYLHSSLSNADISMLLSLSVEELKSFPLEINNNNSNNIQTEEINWLDPEVKWPFEYNCVTDNIMSDEEEDDSLELIFYNGQRKYEYKYYDYSNYNGLYGETDAYIHYNTNKDDIKMLLSLTEDELVDFPPAFEDDLWSPVYCRSIKNWGTLKRCEYSYYLSLEYTAWDVFIKNNFCPNNDYYNPLNYSGYFSYLHNHQVMSHFKRLYPNGTTDIYQFLYLSHSINLYLLNPKFMKYCKKFSYRGSNIFKNLDLINIMKLYKIITRIFEKLYYLFKNDL